jgi:hypothetical protein
MHCISIIKSGLIGFLSFQLAFSSCIDPSNKTIPATQEHLFSGEFWRQKHLIYTKHAICRMECRDISEEEVNYILTHGKINTAKSKENDTENGHCPSYALEGNTNDGQHVRIVFAACDEVTKVITAIDLEKEYRCDCH